METWGHQDRSGAVGGQEWPVRVRTLWKARGKAMSQLLVTAVKKEKRLSGRESLLDAKKQH